MLLRGLGLPRKWQAVCFQSTRSALPARQTFVKWLAAFCVFCCAAVSLPAFSIPKDLDGLLKTIQARYNRTQSLKLDFSETYVGTGRPAQMDSGILYLKKPGRMFWNYTSPAGKIFLSDGKDVYQYSPADDEATRSKLKESDDMRAPLAFLLGKLDFAKEFKSFQSKPGPGGTWIVAEPKSENLAYSQVEFLASPDGEIHQVHITGQDGSKLDFTFSNEQLNAPVTQAMFTFHPPPGVEVVEGGR